MEEKQNSETLTENHILEILGDAICDVGYWSWWTTDLPAVINIEFGGTQLYFPPASVSEPPNSQIVIQLKNPKPISFLTMKESLDESEEKWFDKLHDDKIQHLSCSRYFTFTDDKLIAEIINDAKTITTIHGYSPKYENFLSEKYKLSFWAGNYGFAAASEKIRIFAKSGEIAIKQIPAVNSEWWIYWRKYWDLRNTKNPLPKDYACEVTIPAR